MQIQVSDTPWRVLSHHLKVLFPFTHQNISWVPLMGLALGAFYVPGLWLSVGAEKKNNVSNPGGDGREDVD